MALIDIIRSGVAIASSVTDSLKADVTFLAWIGEDGMGNDVFATPVTVRCLVDPSARERVTASGKLVMTFATLTVVDPMDDTTPNSPFTRSNPVDPRDQFILPGGGTAPVVEAGGFMDAGTERGFIGEIVLGSVIRGT